MKINKKTVKISLLVAFVLAALSIPLNISSHKTASATPPKDYSEDIKRENEWVNRTFNAMSEDERIGQLFMIRAHSNKGAEHEKAVEKLIRDYHVGGLCFFQGTPEKQVELTNRFQALASKVPLMISMDAEWGLGMRFKKDGLSYPKQLMLGAIQDNTLIYDMGKQIAKELRRVGVHINFAPVVDVNNNPNNPVINTRSFGEDRYNVTAKGYMYMKGMQDNDVMACAKHFPGHGDTDVDSHLDLPQILHPRERLDSIEMFPFQVLSQHGIQSMMVAHLFIPSIDNRSNLPTTLSDKAIQNILRGEMGFDGLIFTDGLGMKGVTKHHKVGDLEVKALQAGNDVLLLPENTPAAYQKIKAALANGSLDASQVNESVKRILRAKYKLGLTSFTPIAKENVRADVTGPASLQMKRKLIANALTLVRNKNKTLPYKEISKKKIAALAIGTKEMPTFHKYLEKYDDIATWTTSAAVSNPSTLLNQLKKYDEVVVSFHNMSSRASKKYGIHPNAINFLAQLNSVTNVSVVIFGNPYSLKYFDGMETVLVAYDDEQMVQEVTAQAVYGALPIKGRLPISAGKSQFWDGVSTPSLMRLQYDSPESVGMNPQVLRRLDTIAQEALTQKATPGLQVLVAKNGKVVFHKSYGHHTRKKKKRIQNNDLFDVASVTKIMASTLSMMKLQGEGKINVNNPINQHLSKVKGTNKSKLVLKDILAHQARLKSWIPFYKETITASKRNPRPAKKYYRKKKGGKFTIPVTDNLYLDKNYPTEVWKQIYESELRTKSGYKYSDLGFYLAAAIVKENTGKPLDQFALEQFYQPLGLTHTLYNPLEKYAKGKIVPTEIDRYFRRQTIQGNVHDMGAAMLGGVSGHAGLFSTGNDLAVLSQMLLNSGYYGGKQYLQAGDIQQFTTRVKGSTRRGIGFDMKETNASKTLNMSDKASKNTFGHLGFTGTAVWIDPDHQLTFIFLSNRTYPTMKNYKLNKLDIRPRMHTTVYDAINN